MMKRIALVLPLSAALMLSTNLLAQDHGDYHDHVYDRHHKDYHNFDAHEERAWRVYWQQQHHAYVDWNHANARQQQAYWDWRHNHSDAVLNINIR